MATTYSLGKSIKVSAAFIAFLWCLKVTEWLFVDPLYVFGIYPRDWNSIWGIFTAPLIHGSLSHIAANSVGLLVLGSALVYGYPKSRWPTLIIIWLVSGAGVWLLGRESYHLGASGITHGLFFYLFVISLFRRDMRSIVLMMIAFFMFGSMILTIFPREPGISFEYHLFGAIGGVIAAVLFKSWDPKPKRKVYSWEREPEPEDEEEWWKSPEFDPSSKSSDDPERDKDNRF